MIYFINDTTGQHCGCDATMEVIKENLTDVNHWQKTQDIFPNREAFYNSEVVVLHGEGTLHHGQGSANRMMRLLDIAQRLGKRTAIFNAVLQDMDGWAGVFRKLDYFAVRDPKSWAYAKKFNRKVKLFRDLTLDERFAQEASHEHLHPVQIGDTHPPGVWIDARKMTIRGRGQDLYLNMPFRKVVARLRNPDVKVYVTGQYHGIIAAILANKPFVPLRSNSWKIEALLEMGNVKIPFLDSINKFDQELNRTLESTHVYTTLRQNLMNTPQMKATDFRELIQIKIL